MKITKVSTLTGIERTLEINVTQEQIDRWQAGELIQRVMPNVPEDEREFLITGVTKEEWDEHFNDEEE